MTVQQESQNKRIAGLTTAGIFAILFVLMFYIIIWSPGNPPAFGGSGVEVVLGTAESGYGDFDPAITGDNASKDDAPVQNEEQQSAPEEAQPKETTPVQQPPVKAEEAIEEVKSEEESPVKVNPPKKEPVKEPVKQTPKKEDAPVKVEKANPTTVFNPNAKNTSADPKATSGGGKKGEAGDQGDQPGTKGDMGNPNGKVDDTGIYKGNPGKGGDGPGGEGFGLTMSGWTWDSVPDKPSLTDNESGFVIFEVTIDDQGEIINTRKVEGTLSAEAVKRCEAKIRERSFVRTAGGAIPPQSKGRVRFNLRVQ